MTNEMIILAEAQRLAEAGIIAYTGRTIEAMDAEGNPILFEETEAIHTFAYWKSLGFSVKKGSKAVTQVMIWKCVQKQVQMEDSNGQEITEEQKRMFMKRASFFSASQVEPLTSKRARRKA